MTKVMERIYRIRAWKIDVGEMIKEAADGLFKGEGN